MTGRTLSPRAAQEPQREHRAARIALATVAWFSLLSAVAGATGLLGNGIGLPLSWLEGSPFHSYFWPGTILGGVVGGSQLLAITAQFRRWAAAWALHGIAGFGMIIWIYVEVAILPVYAFLHTLYFAVGVLQCVLVMIVLGAWPSLHADGSVRPSGSDRAERRGP